MIEYDPKLDYSSFKYVVTKDLLDHRQHPDNPDVTPQMLSFYKDVIAKTEEPVLFIPKYIEDNNDLTVNRKGSETYVWIGLIPENKDYVEQIEGLWSWDFRWLDIYRENKVGVVKCTCIQPWGCTCGAFVKEMKAKGKEYCPVTKMWC